MGNAKTAAEILLDTLAARGADRAFSVPGESYIALLDALHAHPSIDLVTCRHEGGAGFMAVADAKLTGRPGIVLVSRGPGACNAAIALHTAEQDAVPPDTSKYPLLHGLRAQDGRLRSQRAPADGAG